MIARLIPAICRHSSKKWETRFTHQVVFDLGCEGIHLQGGMEE
jgi:hypothetical protein